MMKFATHRDWIWMAGLALLLTSILAFLYVRTQAYDTSGYFGNVELLRQIRQLDSRWELDVMRSKAGINANYDSLVDPLVDLDRLQERLQMAVAIEPHENASGLAAVDKAFSDAIREKTALIEHFKSHNSVLRNSLDFLPTAAEDARSLVRARGEGGMTARRNICLAVNAVLLDTMEYSQAPSEEGATRVMAGLGRLSKLGAGERAPVRERLGVFATHIMTVLREQPVVNGLLYSIAIVPTTARIDEFNRLLSGEQNRFTERTQQGRQYLLAFAAALVALFLFALVRLIRSHAAISRASNLLHESNAGLELRVGQRTSELLATNAELRLGEARLALQAQELAAARDIAEAANQAKSAVLATMSHELRTPLNAVIGFAELIQLQPFGALGHPRYLEYVGDIRSSGAHLLSLINDILDLSRLDAGKADLVEEEFSLRTLIGEACRTMVPQARRDGLELVADLAPDLPNLRADRRRIKQIVLNLLSNAIKFTPERGTVTIGGSMSDGELRLTVRDTGIGMSKADLPKALERFGQVDNSLSRKYEGSGLGLPLTKQLIELHDAKFDISSEPGRGTLVTIAFPADRVVALVGWSDLNIVSFPTGRAMAAAG